MKAILGLGAILLASGLVLASDCVSNYDETQESKNEIRSDEMNKYTLNEEVEEVYIKEDSQDYQDS